MKKELEQDGWAGAELQYSRDPYPQVGNSQVGE